MSGFASTFLLALILSGCSTPDSPTSSQMSDQDPAQVYMNNLEPVPCETIQAGTVSGIARRSRLVIQSNEEWIAFWNRHASRQRPVSEPPAVDFDNQTVLAVLMGQQSSGGYSIEIQSVYQVDGALEVNVMEREPDRNVMTISALTAPFHLVAIPKWEKEIRFNKEPRSTQLRW